MEEEKMDIFAQAWLYIYQARFENMGLKADVKAVRRKTPEEPVEEVNA